MSGRAIETPSGKGAGDENFPVGSRLLPARLRPHVARYYRFARAIDDIADNGELAPEDKIRRLDQFALAITNPTDTDPALETAHVLRESLADTGVTPRHCLDLIKAFKQDAVKLRYKDWPDLLNYCAYSANPVGRYLLDLHGEETSAYVYSDALCSALQVLNHLQDCGDDFRTLDRVYIPADWLAAEGLEVAVLAGGPSPPGFRQVLDRCLDGVEELIDTAKLLPRHLVSWRLAMESEVIVRLAQRLTRRLRSGDPLAERVALTKGDFFLAGLGGMAGESWRRLAGRRPARGKVSVERP
jgi:squalene synthase HpnC